MMHAHVFTGVVGKGSSLGRRLGFPTINLIETGALVFEQGVYRVLVDVYGKTYKGALHFGPRRTLGEHVPVLEIHLLDFDRDLYGKEVSVRVFEKIREVKQFENLESLKKRIGEDVNYVRENGGS